MTDPRQDEPADSVDERRDSARDEVAGGGDLPDTDDTTEADQGMPAGTGAIPTEGATQPLGTDPLADEDEQGETER